MKIVRQKVFLANASRTNFVFVKLWTDEGIEGVGEATLEWKTLTVVAALNDLERAVLRDLPLRGGPLEGRGGRASDRREATWAASARPSESPTSRMPT